MTAYPGLMISYWIPRHSVLHSPESNECFLLYSHVRITVIRGWSLVNICEALGSFSVVFPEE